MGRPILGVVGTKDGTMKISQDIRDMAAADSKPANQRPVIEAGA